MQAMRVLKRLIIFCAAYFGLPAVLTVFTLIASTAAPVAAAGTHNANVPAQKTVPAVTGNAHVDKLLSEMTLDEKISMIHGEPEPPSTFQGQAGYMAGIPRLGIPPLRLADGPPGVLTRVPATAPTSTMGLAATFSLDDAKENGALIARDAKARGIDIVLEPFINIDRDITFSRGYNTFGEDPFLTGNIGGALIQGVQSNGVMSMAKHYLAYNTDGDDVYVDPQSLHEIYAAPFADAVNAGVAAIMCSYNKVNGEYSCGNSLTLNKLLKEEAGFKGFVTSDWGANHANIFLNAGLDLEMPGPHSWLPSFFEYAPPEIPAWSPPTSDDFAEEWINVLPEESSSFHRVDGAPVGNLWTALHAGLVNEAAITSAAGRILLQMDRFGLLDGKPHHTLSLDTTAANAQVVLKTAEDAAVLLKNQDGILPLKKADLDSLALIGPGALQTIAVGHAIEKAVGLPERQVGTLEALRKYVGSPAAAKIGFAVADNMTGAPVPADHLSHNGQPGLERIKGAQAAAVVAVDPQINFTLRNGNALPANSSFDWRGTLTVPARGKYRMYLQVLGCYGVLRIDGQHITSNGKMNSHGDITQPGQDNILPTVDGLDNLRTEVELAAGPHQLSVSVVPDSSSSPLQVRLSWVTPEQQKANYAAAISLAKQAKTAVVFLWSRSSGQFELPGNQDQLVEDIVAVNPNTIVVLNVTQPAALPWLHKVKAVLQMWWPGDEGGWATANILTGKTSPAGRLPFTWAKALEDYPAGNRRHPERRANGVDGKTVFSEGLLVGYRWFDQQNIEPVFPFGHGLSYTSFEYSGITLTRAEDGGLNVKFRVTNVGTAASDEVPQVYLDAPADAPDEKVQFAKRSLAGFCRLHLNSGQTKDVMLHVPIRSLEYWSTSSERWVLARGSRKVHVGSSSRDLRLEATQQM